MENAPAPLTGNLFTLPGDPVSVARPPYSARRWSITIGRDWLTISSANERFGATQRHGGSTLAVSAVVGGLALLLVGASAGRALSTASAPTTAEMIVPAAKPLPRAARPAGTTRAPTGRTTPPAAAAAPTDPDATDTLGTLTRSQAVAKALRTGEFQEWADRDGTSGFAVPGPAEAGPQGPCRALAVLSRRIDGSDSVASTRECGEATVRR